ncbi:Histidine--tRNA ligase [Candidatus Magnetaquicoccaceae bacterium FCR-1]|uniref:Histidine--tRNA ligase n=1 Tax=Candidatus Magnetaquiglobus chichijimensis TaxID=3141448 RepID=A0ABQ0CBY0_9PROT
MIQTVRGVRDIPPEESGRWSFLEERARRIFAQYGYRELRTPLFERVELFSRAVGEATDIVEKEMYVFEDRGGERLCLRPEGTASAVRSFIETSRHRSLPWRVFYMGPMFRYERPQKGRYRQFHQIGCELFGPEGPLADAEMMALVLRLLRAIGIGAAVTLEINSLGCPVCRAPYREKLVNHLESVRSRLCGNCQNRLERNPLRVLDCKEEDPALLAGVPHMRDHLCAGCESHFQGLLTHLDRLALPYRLNPLMVRGLDYYHRTAFEAVAGGLGAQNAVAAGGRYDGLVAEMGGVSTPAIGFAMGMERLLMLMDESLGAPEVADLYLVAVGDGVVEAEAVRIAEGLREKGIAVEMHLGGGGMKSQMKHAGRSRAPLAVIIGQDELTEGVATVKAMESGSQERVARGELDGRILALLGRSIG